jgi:hypothetical protein
VVLADWACAGCAATLASKAAAETRPKREMLLAKPDIQNPPVFDSHWLFDLVVRGLSRQ